MTIQSKFADSLQILRDAVNGDISLETDYPSLFSQVCRFYENKGVRFWGIDIEEDYAYLIDHLVADNVLA
ncbi:hypothetical protein BOW92_gp056 [Synechococcus phage S-WAM1]|jgi:hypothetical protein|uniref:Uncharacterized protein n=1 Tax=Synechococcus phage S-WAM1 TaxID=1815521 RepID=A0A1D8KSM0_9CAUD|nr:hypothetical protein BOW92_gp056 [Synechococcus phage S-WAM1]AOV61661.1 hypothetical protein P090810_188 [Synechococcus phage S-WAM1]